MDSSINRLLLFLSVMFQKIRDSIVYFHNVRLQGGPIMKWLMTLISRFISTNQINFYLWIILLITILCFSKCCHFSLVLLLTWSQFIINFMMVILMQRANIIKFCVILTGLYEEFNSFPEDELACSVIHTVHVVNSKTLELLNV